MGERHTTAIIGIGTAVPDTVRPQAEVVRFMAGVLDAGARLERRLRVLYRRTGIERRHSCVRDFLRRPADFDFLPRRWRDDPGPPTARRLAVFRDVAPALAARAARAAAADVRDAGACDAAGGFDASSFDVARVSHLIVVSCTGLFAPGLDVDLVAALGLRPDVARMQIGFQGCHAGLASLRLADSICRGDPAACVLVVCVELCTLHFQTAPADDNLLANALFADGAAAALLQAAPEGAARPRLEITGAATWLEPGTRDGMAWTIGEHGFVMRLSPRLPRLIGAHIEDFLRDRLRLAGGALEALDFWAVHPGGPAILDRIQQALRLERDRLHASREVLKQYGNMSSPTVFFVLQQLRAELAGAAGNGSGAAGNGSGAAEPRRGVAIAFGPGLTIEGLALEARWPAVRARASAPAAAAQRGGRG